MPAWHGTGMSWPRFETTESQAKKSRVWESKPQRFTADKTRLENEAEICTVKDCEIEHLATGSTEVHGPRPLVSALWVPHSPWRGSGAGAVCRQPTSVPRGWSRARNSGGRARLMETTGVEMTVIDFRDLKCNTSNIEFLLLIFRPVPLWVFLPILINPQAKMLSVLHPPPTPHLSLQEAPLFPASHRRTSLHFNCHHPSAGCPSTIAAWCVC